MKRIIQTASRGSLRIPGKAAATNNLHPLIMKTHIEFHGLPASARWFFLIQSFLHAQQGQLKVAAARAAIRRQDARSPGFSASLHLEIPGPDLKAEGSGCTLMEAWQKACGCLEEKIREREQKRAQSRKLSAVKRCPA